MQTAPPAISPLAVSVGAPSVCPHCGGGTVLQPHDALRWVCGACGGPRVPLDVPVQRSGKERPALVVARRARFSATGWRAGASVLVATAVILLSVAAMLAGAALMSAILLGAVCLGVTLASLVVFRLARGSDRETKEQLDLAWTLVAEEALRAHGGKITAPELARAMRVVEPEAERLLTLLSAGDRVRVEIGDDAELAYVGTSANAAVEAGAPHAKVRVEASPEEPEEPAHETHAVRHAR